MDLCIPDTREAKFQLIFELADTDLLPPTYILSHKRANNLRTLRLMPQLRNVARVVVCEEEEAEYRRAGHDRLVLIPSGYRGLDKGLGRAKQFCLDYAEIKGHENILTLDDDLIAMTTLYPRESGGVSRAYTQHISSKSTFCLGQLVLFAAVADAAFASNPRAVVASPQCNNSNRTIASSRIKYEMNRGGNPSQCVSWHVDRFSEKCGEMDSTFYRHGEDIALALQIVEAGGAVVNVPSIVCDYLDYETQSVMRTPETAVQLRQQEHDDLMELPLAKYVRTRTDIIGRPQWHTADWKALKRDGIAQDDEQVLWIED